MRCSTVPLSRIAIDVMSGDQGFRPVFKALRPMARRHPDMQFVLVGDTAVTQPLAERMLWSRRLLAQGRLEFHHASEVISMSDNVSEAMRRRPDSSMRQALLLQQSGEVSAVVSAGNTACLLSLSRQLLKTFSGVSRPALCAELPARQGRTWMLDLGANSDCQAEHLLQFALMGDALARSVGKLDNPRLRLLNIGEEESKGLPMIREAAKQLAQGKLNYLGFIEPNRLFEGDAEVIICDGFSGNIALKSSEGAVSLVYQALKAEMDRSWWKSLLAKLLLPRLEARIDPTARNGASLLGLKGTVVKCHGNADKRAWMAAIETAISEVANNSTALVEKALAESFLISASTGE
jgi:glycerol-3-phosphate acyltransferase PlsX